VKRKKEEEQEPGSSPPPTASEDDSDRPNPKAKRAKNKKASWRTPPARPHGRPPPHARHRTPSTARPNPNALHRR
jgi:hypothetical protein